jgi:hypothetical protein
MGVAFNVDHVFSSSELSWAGTVETNSFGVTATAMALFATVKGCH